MEASYYLFCPQRRAFWRPKSHGYTSRKEAAGRYTKEKIEGWGYAFATSQNFTAMMSLCKSFAVHVGDADTLNVLQRLTPDVPAEVFV